MPAKSKAQLRLMYAALKDPEVRGRYGMSLKVVREFLSKDRKRAKKLPERVKKSA